MEKTLYKFLLFFLLALGIIDLSLLLMATAFKANFPQLAPFSWILLLSFSTVGFFLFIAWKKYREQFGAK